jgi:hypothetical protein
LEGLGGGIDKKRRQGNEEKRRRREMYDEKKLKVVSNFIIISPYSEKSTSYERMQPMGAAPTMGKSGAGPFVPRDSASGQEDPEP